MMHDDPDIRVRPIPLDADEHTGAPQVATVPEAPTSRPGRLLAATVAVAAVLIAVGSLGSLGDRTGEPEPEVAEATSPHLEDDAGLVLAAAATPGGWAITWTPLPGTQSTGAIGAIPAPTAPSAQSPTTDAGKTWSASTRCSAVACELDIAPIEGATAVATVATRAHAWHSEDANRLAWIETTNGTAVLRTGTIDSANGLTPDPPSAPVDGDTRLALWDDNGFIIGTDAVLAIDQAGEPIWTAEGTLLEATSSTVTVEVGAGEWLVLDRVSGSTLVEGSPRVVLIAREREVEPVASVARNGYRYTFSISQTTDTSLEGIRPDYQRLPIGFDEGTTYRLLSNVTGDRFTFHLTRPESTS